MYKTETSERGGGKALVDKTRRLHTVCEGVFSARTRNKWHAIQGLLLMRASPHHTLFSTSTSQRQTPSIDGTRHRNTWARKMASQELE